MSTSGSYAFSVNRDDIIRLAMLNIGKLDQSEIPTAMEMSDCAMFLNSLVKQWQGTNDFAPGLKTWTRRRGHLFLSYTTGQYALGPGATGWTLSYVQTMTNSVVSGGVAVVPVATTTGMSTGDSFGVELASGSLYWGVIQSINPGVSVTLTVTLPSPVPSGSIVYDYSTLATQPLKIEFVNLRDIQGNDTPIRTMNQAEYDNLPSKVSPTNVSDPSSIYYEFQLTNGQLYTDVAGSQDLTKHLVITYLEAEQDMVNPLDVPEYPQEWYLALALGLSKLIAPMFSAQWSPVMDENAKMALAVAQKKEPETVIAYFQPGDLG